MLNEYTKEIVVLRAWYTRAKDIAIKAESMDSLNKGYIQPLHELRYCLDHFMRCFDYEQAGESQEIIKKSISSAIGHLQRTYSDSIEWMLVNVKEEYIITLDDYKNEQIQMVFPEYYSEIRPSLEKITKVINEYKINKSVEKATEIISDNELEILQVVTDQFLTEDVAEKLQIYLDILHDREASLIEVKKRDRKAAIKDKIVIPLMTGIIGVVLGFVLQLIFL
jgi:hypothetical protein